MLLKNIIIKELPKLVGEGVITNDIADRIRAHYEKSGGPKINILLVAFGVLGAVLVGGGIILLLAHNWDDLSRPLRTVISIAPLLAAQGLCAYAIMKQRDSTAWREAAGAFLFLAIGISISLISQTYNIYGDLGRFVLTWSLLALPVVYLLDAAVPALFYLAGVGAWAGVRAFDSVHPWLYWPLVAAIVPYGYYLHQRFRDSLRIRLLSWAGVIFILSTLEFIFLTWRQGSTAFSPQSLSLMAYAALFSALYLAGSLPYYDDKNLFSNPALIAGSLGMPVLMLVYTFESPWTRLSRIYLDRGIFLSAHGWMAIAVTALLIACAIALLVFLLRRRRLNVIPIGSAFILFAIGYLLALWNFPVTVNQIMFNLALLALGVATVVQGVSAERLALVNFGMLIIAALVACRFFDSDLSFVVRGVVFIALGAGFLAVNYVIVRRRKSA